MKTLAQILALLLAVTLPGAANAQIRLTDVVTFGADTSGSVLFQPDVWETRPGGNFDNWLQSLPSGTFLNGPSDTAVQPNITLVPGTNSFRVYTSPGIDNANFGLNLFFNGAQTPSISAFGPMLTSANQVHSFAADSASPTPTPVPVLNSGIPGAGTLTFETSNQVITLTDFYLATPSVFNLDQASQMSLGPDEVMDYVGGFTLVVSNKTNPSDCTPPPAGLVAWWPGEGDANDIVGTNNGTLSSSGATYVNGKVGLGFHLDGTNGYVQIPDSDALKPTNVTAEAWVWLDPNVTNNGGEYIIFKRNTWTYLYEGYALAKARFDNGNGTYTDRFQFLVTRNGNQVALNSTTVAQRGVWYHVAGTYDGNKSTLWVNGVAESSATPGFALDYGTRPVFIGTSGEPAPYTGYLAGIIDEPSIYNRALSTNEIAAIYSAGSAGKCKPAPDCTPAPVGLVAWWPGDGNANDVFGANNGFVTNEVVNYTNGEVDLAFSYNGAGGYVEVPASSALNVGLGAGFTLEGWIKPDDLVNQLPLFEWQYDGTEVGVHFWTSTTGGAGSLYANIIDTNNNAHSFYSAAGILTTNYQHVALTYDKTTGLACIYRNGVIVASQNLGVFTPKTQSNVLLGARTYLTGAVPQFIFSGSLDEMSLYNRALSTNEITAIYNAGSAGKCQTVAAIIQQPLNQTMVTGSGTTLSVGLGGTGPFTYQWRFNGANISGATNATLTLANLHSNQSGHYSVVITTPGGTLISSDAIVTVIAQDILIYSYSGKEQITTFSQDLAYNYSGQMLLIPAGTNGTFVGWANINGKKQYWVSPLTDYLWITVARKNSHNYTVLGRAGDGIDPNGYPHLWSSLHRGVNTQLAIAKKRTFSFPDTFSCVDNHIYPDTNTGKIIMVDASSTYQFAPANTQTANNAGQTLTDLVNALTKSLEKQGYQKQ